MWAHDELNLYRNLALENMVFHKELAKQEDNGLKMSNEARLETLGAGAFPIRLEMETLNKFPLKLAWKPALIPL